MREIIRGWLPKIEEMVSGRETELGSLFLPGLNIFEPIPAWLSPLSRNRTQEIPSKH